MINLGREKTLTILNTIIEYSLYILLFSTPFSNTIIEICAIIAIICWGLKKLFFERRDLRLAQTDLNVPLLLFYAISLFSISWSTNPGISIQAFITKLTEYILLYFIVVETVNKRKIACNMMIALTASAFLISIDGLWQRYITGVDFIRGHPLFPISAVAIRGGWYEFKGFDSIMSQTFKGYPISYFARITASFTLPNGLSAWLLIVSFPFISLALFYKKNLKLRTAYSILSISLVYCLFLTFTRGAYVSFILALLLLSFLINRKVFYVAAAFLLIAIMVFLAVGGVRIDLSSIFSFDMSGLQRVKIWTTAWRMFIDRPFLGQGLNTFMANYPRFRIANGPDEGRWYAHNFYLQTAAEIGIFGVLAFLWMIAKMVIVSFKSWRLIDDEFLRYAYLGLFCGVVSFLIHNSVEMSLYSLRLAVLFYFSLGLLMGIKRVGSEKDRFD